MGMVGACRVRAGKDTGPVEWDYSGVYATGPSYSAPRVEL